MVIVSFADVFSKLKTIHDQGVYLPINFTFAPETKLSAKNVRKAVNEYGLFSRKTTWDTASTSKEVPFLDRSPTVATVDAAPAPSSDSLHAQIQALLAPTKDDMKFPFLLYQFMPFEPSPSSIALIRVFPLKKLMSPLRPLNL